MGKLPKQTKRRDIIKRFRALGWTGPHDGGKGDHPEYMAHKDGRTVKLPNPHRSDVGEGLMKLLLAEAALSVGEWLGSKPDVGTAPEAGESAQPLP